MPLTFALVIAGYAGILGYVVYAYQTALATDARQDAFVLNAVDLARQAQVDFKIQVQEWKNTLLRGHDPKAFEKYSAAFTRTEAEVQARLAALKVMLSGAGRDTGDLEKLAASHRELGDKYRSALKSYDSADGKSPQRVDTAVTGIDRAPTKAMDGLVAAIQEMGAQRQVEAAREHRRLQMTFLALALAVTLPFAAIGWWLTRSITRPLDGVVRRLQDLAEGEGDLTKRLEVRTRDELGHLSASFNAFMDKLHDIIAQAKATADHVATATQELSAASEQHIADHAGAGVEPGGDGGRARRDHGDGEAERGQREAGEPARGGVAGHGGEGRAGGARRGDVDGGDQPGVEEDRRHHHGDRRDCVPDESLGA